MKLPLSPSNQVLVLDVLEKLNEAGIDLVLVGGLVPPLLVEALRGDTMEELDLPPRTTRDCDLAFVTGHDAAATAVVEETLTEAGFKQENAFRWRHLGGLKVDAMPVPVGIEVGDPSAVALAARYVEHDPTRFFRGYELALEIPRHVTLLGDEGAIRGLAIADVTAMFAMKLQAFADRPYDRHRDAFDIVWVARQLDADQVAHDLIRCRDLRPELVDEIVGRLEANFCDPWARGIGAYFEEAFRGRTSFDEEARREAGATAIEAVLRAYRRRRLWVRPT